MDPANLEALAVIDRTDLKLSQKLGELVAMLPNTQSESLEANMATVSKFSQAKTGPPRKAAKVGAKTSPANFESPELEIACADDKIRKLKFFGYAPGAVYSPSLNATWAWVDQDGTQHHYMEYVSEKMFWADNAAYNPDAAGLLKLLEQSVQAYSQAVAKAGAINPPSAD